MIIQSRVLVEGTVHCTGAHEVLHSTVPLSFWGGVDPLSGEIIDHTHPLRGGNIAGKILSIPSGRGSCTGSQVMLELILNGRGPRAILLRDVDAILCTGAVIAEEVFEEEIRDKVPWIVCVGEVGFEILDGVKFASIKHETENDTSVCLVTGENENNVIKELLTLSSPASSKESSSKRSISDSTYDLLLEQEEHDILSGRSGSAAHRIALRTICRIARITSSPRLIPVSQAHIDGCTYIGPGGLRFVQKLVELGGQVSIPTTLNSVSADRRRWAQLGMPSVLANPANAVGDAYLKLGCSHSFTCAPYLLPSKPGFGENIIWGESNAVVYANSVLGSRTDKYADYFDICAALVGRVPEFGVHLKENRMPTVKIDVTELVEHHIMPLMKENEGCDFDAFYPTLGYLCGNISGGQVPLIRGMEHLSDVISNDDLKAFCAAFGTTGTAPLFHMAGITPESADPAIVQNMEKNCEGRRCLVTTDDLVAAFQSLDSGGDSCHDRIDLVAFGNPHLSLAECERLAKLVTSTAGKSFAEGAKSEDCKPAAISPYLQKKHRNVKVMATLSRHVFDEAASKGFVKTLEDFGVQFINDTCWCMLLDPPVIPNNKNAVIMTNSGKYAHYGPGLTNRKMRFGGMSDCIQAARNGRWDVREGTTSLKTRPKWLMPGNVTSQHGRSFVTLAHPHRRWIQNEVGVALSNGSGQWTRRSVAAGLWRSMKCFKYL